MWASIGQLTLPTPRWCWVFIRRNLNHSRKIAIFTVSRAFCNLVLVLVLLVLVLVLLISLVLLVLPVLVLILVLMMLLILLILIVLVLLLLLEKGLLF